MLWRIVRLDFLESIFIDQATLNGTRPNSPSGVKPARPLVGPTHWVATLRFNSGDRSDSRGSVRYWVGSLVLSPISEVNRGLINV